MDKSQIEVAWQNRKATEKACFLDIAVILTSWIILILFYFIDSTGEASLNLFQRSGAIAVLGTVFIEFRYQKLSSPMPSMGYFSEGEPILVGYEPNKKRKRIHQAGLSTGAFGTIIWAYGDLFMWSVTG